jgi:GntR family transcriptional repressor for pyruvate dehydrogenase complex
MSEIEETRPVPETPKRRPSRRREGHDLDRLRPISPETADTGPNDVAHVLIDYMMSGRMSPGDRLPSERHLSELLGVGRSTIREGVKSLGVLGLVEFRHGGGMYVRATESELLPRVVEWGLLLGEQRIAELVEARTFLEVEIAGLAAERRSQERLVELEQAMLALSQASEVDEYVDADLAFHLAVGRASGNGVLGGMLGNISALLRVWIRRNIEAADTLDRSRREHERILDAVRAGDSEAARVAAREHMAGAAKRLLATFDDAQAATLS